MDSKFRGWHTFILALFAIITTFIGTYLNMFDPSVFINVVWAALGAYGFKSAAGYIGDGLKR